MKITKTFPSLLQVMYDNCNDELFLNILITDKIVEIKGQIIDFKQQPNIKVDISPQMFRKCHTYLRSAGFIVEDNNSNDARTNQQIHLTHKAVNYIEDYSFGGKE